jgi:hypothetical protein
VLLDQLLTAHEIASHDVAGPELHSHLEIREWEKPWEAVRGVQPRYGQKPPSVDRGMSLYCSDEVSALVFRAAVEAGHREAVPT